MNWYKKAQIFGEWWITDTGSVLYADGDVGDYNHEAYVVEQILSNYIDIDDSSDLYQYQNYPDADLTQIGMSQDEIDVIKGKTDPREYAMKNWEWIRVADKYVQSWYLTSKILKNIANGLYEAYGNDAFKNTYVIESLSNNKNYSPVPYDVIDSGNPKNLMQYLEFNPMNLRAKSMNWYKKTLTSENNSSNIPPMKKEFIIMRGIPSSGKSSIAKELAGDSGGIFSADDYHITPETGEYNWKLENVQVAHQWNHERIEKAIIEGISPVIADNTNIKKWDLKSLKPLILLAQQKGYDVRIEEPNPDWYHWDTAFDVDVLYERSKKTHNVPYETIQKMVDNYIPNITVDDILNYEK